MNTHTNEVFVGDTCGPDQYVAFFEATEGSSEEETPPGGYLYISDRKDQRIIRHLEIYNDPGLSVHEDDVRIFWSSDGNKCGVAIWGRMRGIINVANGLEMHVPLKGRHSDAITDHEWLSGFENYMDQNQFIHARQRYWKEMVRRYENIESHAEETMTETNFIQYQKGSDGLFAVFEDDDTTGYLYLYDFQAGSIARHLHLYDRSQKFDVAMQDVEVAWSQEGAKCGVIIFGKMRGIIDRQKERPGRVWMEDRNTPGIADPEWLKGFEYLFSKPN